MVHYATPRFSSEGASGTCTPTGRPSGTSTPSRTPRRSTAEDYFFSTMPTSGATYPTSPAGSVRKAFNNCNFAYTPEAKKETAVKEPAKRESLARKIKNFVNKGTTEYWDSPERSLALTGALPKSYQAKAAVAEEKN